MHPTVKDAIGGLRAEAKRFREMAKGKRQQLSRLKDRGFGHRDFMAEVDCKLRITEYVRAAQDRDKEIKRLKAESGIIKNVLACMGCEFAKQEMKRMKIARQCGTCGHIHVVAA